MSDGFDAVLAIDINTLPLTNVLKLLDSAISAGYRAARLPRVSTREHSFAAEIAHAAVNRVNPAGRCNAGFSCGLSSSGFCLAKSLLTKIPFAADTADNVQFYESKLVLADEPIAFLHETALLQDASLELSNHSGGATTGELWRAAFAGNLSALERICERLAPKAGTILIALPTESLAGGLLMAAGKRFAEITQLYDYGQTIIIISLLSATALLFYFSVAFFTWWSESILRKAAGNIAPRAPADSGRERDEKSKTRSSGIHPIPTAHCILPRHGPS
jgi:hypothetical protein